MSETHKRWPTIFAFVYNINAVVILSLQMYYINPIQWNHILETSLNFAHLAMWWAVWIKKKHICVLVGKLKFLEKELEYLDRKKLVKVSRAAVSCVIVLTCLYPILWLMRCMYFKRLNWPFELASVHDQNVLFLKFMYDFGNAYLSCGATFSVATFYTLYCFILATGLRLKKRSPLQAFTMYKDVVHLFKAIENTLSFFVLLFFAYTFSKLFKDIYIILYAVRVRSSKYPLIGSFELFTHVIWMAMMILSADLAQKATEVFRLSLYEYIHLPGCFECPFNRLMEDRKCLKLTAWGVFQINKSLFLGITTWIFTYSVVLLQFPQDSVGTKAQ
ncbi:uncharacterized protein CDAR_411211 [Caerostris darwini]|uniref:Gustatory receptor n=1 Tax=Caerostris darwini TaxID=1538125 RepID=A0AAV4SFB4_9ARAC|nr:uncharacterized protein CDAR_411211 [Caerostris darwini]